MIRDFELLDRLSSFPTKAFDGEVFRVTPRSLPPLTPTMRGGRWVPVSEVSVLYTSMDREGALAEVAFHWSQLTPLPSKSVLLHGIRLTARRTLRLVESDLSALGIQFGDYRMPNYSRTQEIGFAVEYLGCDGLIVPSVRWDCENLVLFMDNHDITNELKVTITEEIDLQSWASEHGLLDEPSRD